MAVINMSKNQKISMVKEDGNGMKNIFVGANWDMNRYAGEANIDLDIHGFLTSGDRKVVYPQDIVNYSTYNSADYPWIDYSGDNQTGDDSVGGMEFNGKHYDEGFIIHTDKIPADRSELTICLTIYQAVKRLQNFGMISNATLTICDYDDPNAQNTYVFDMSEDDNFANLNAVEMGRLYRYNDGFKFQALGSGYVGGMTELYKNFGMDITE